ncbi:MAG: 16S rRNA (guanine(527)-N(7))-methyltransferase [uncultured Sphingomonadaceae bacterium]|uniref:Ribosomal RNA small subunit methyltransferase G n=1 Tax=uncultured Sphingomonadaceae bacterium TaxID=169976 RepID=A0A6J4U4T3_9SPHN|nr:MAG: 16S rRNA (guanine(527)-N(7))-methyltransferase [uncultured Sphingomonadaceae bacterium]
MTGDENGKQEFLDLYSVPRETLRNLELFEAELIEENRRQNLIARSTEAEFWTRHLLDSAQLTEHIPPHAKTCLDVGSGAGLPGIVLATITNAAYTLVEPRRLRVEFLLRVASKLSLTDRVEILCAKIEKITRRQFDVITARAFASLSNTLKATRHLAQPETVWLLPKGRSAEAEIAEAKNIWNAHFETLPSKTSAEGHIVRVSHFQGMRT